MRDPSRCIDVARKAERHSSELRIYSQRPEKIRRKRLGAIPGAVPGGPKDKVI
jgi:hypothetical protein